VSSPYVKELRSPTHPLLGRDEGETLVGKYALPSVSLSDRSKETLVIGKFLSNSQEVSKIYLDNVSAQ
jgi:hypothetical protein